MNIKAIRSAWGSIDHVLLDMDGTLLDKHFDDYFWEQFVPENYALENDMTEVEARAELLALYKKREGTLDWTDLDYWSTELGLDIPQLKVQVDHLIDVHPYVIDFLVFCRECGKNTCIVTNAHSKTLEIKMAKTALEGHFDQVVCSQQVGVAKEDPQFWKKLKKWIAFDPNRTLLADDTEKVLLSAESGGIAHLVHVARPSSRSPVKPSARFASITYFKELMP